MTQRSGHDFERRKTFAVEGGRASRGHLMSKGDFGVVPVVGLRVRGLKNSPPDCLLRPAGRRPVRVRPLRKIPPIPHGIGGILCVRNTMNKRCKNCFQKGRKCEELRPQVYPERNRRLRRHLARRKPIRGCFRVQFPPAGRTKKKRHANPKHKAVTQRQRSRFGNEEQQNEREMSFDV